MVLGFVWSFAVDKAFGQKLNVDQCKLMAVMFGTFFSKCLSKSTLWILIFPTNFFNYEHSCLFPLPWKNSLLVIQVSGNSCQCENTLCSHCQVLTTINIIYQTQGRMLYQGIQAPRNGLEKRSTAEYF